MKKIFLLTALFLQFTFVFGQERDEVGHRVTPWVIARHGCFNGLEWKVRKSYYSDNSDNFINEIEIKNKYSSKITFSFDISADANAKTTQSRKTLNPGETTRFTRVQNVDFVYLYIADVCFNSDNRCTGTCYALCDNGTPNIPNDCGGQKSNSNNNSAGQTTNDNTSTSQPNDLTEYNRSKADLERQMAEKNAEGQQKSQNYSLAMNAGIAAHNSGDYTEAKRQFSIALNNCNTEEARQKAQEYYNKSIGAEKSQTKIKAVGDLVQGTLQILGDAHERKMQKLNAEIDELKRKNAIVEADQKINTLNDPKIFETYCDYVAENLEKIGFTFEKLENYTNIENKEKTAFLKFKGINIHIRNSWSYEKMSKYVTFIADNQNEYQKLINSTFFINLSKLNPNYDKSYNSFDHTNLYTLGLEKQEDFINTYNQGYISKNYIGFINLSKKMDENAENKLNSMGNTTFDILEKAKLYTFGAEGVKKNYLKAVEIYQNAYNQSNDKEILREIGKLYAEGDEYLAENENKAEEYFLNYTKDNDKIDPTVYVQLARLYDDKSSALYDLKKTENYLLTAIPILEKKYNNEMDEKKRKELKGDIIYAYSNLTRYYQYSFKNPTLYVEYAEKLMQWDENDCLTTFQLAKLYADGKFTIFDKKSDNFNKDKKKAKYWASKLSEIAENLENKNSGSFEANNAKKWYDLLKRDYKSLF